MGRNGLELPPTIWTNPINIVFTEARHKNIPNVRFHLYQVQKEVKLI